MAISLAPGLKDSAPPTNSKSAGVCKQGGSTPRSGASPGRRFPRTDFTFQTARTQEIFEAVIARHPSRERAPDDGRAKQFHRPNRHCERSEAIHAATKERVDCFAALAMTWIHFRILAARCTRGLPKTSALKTEGVGNAGRP